MDERPADTILYRRANFATRLPKDYLYCPSHFWIAREESDRLRVGFTKFATRMLGEIVEHSFDVPEGAPVSVGQAIGSIEGFKALSDLYCVAAGTFAGGNEALAEKIELIDRDPFGRGWLYKVQGTPDERWTDVDGYVRWLDKTIDRMQEETHPEQNDR